MAGPGQSFDATAVLQISCEDTSAFVDNNNGRCTTADLFDIGGQLEAQVPIGYTYVSDIAAGRFGEVSLLCSTSLPDTSLTLRVAHRVPENYAARVSEQLLELLSSAPSSLRSAVRS